MYRREDREGEWLFGSASRYCPYCDCQLQWSERTHFLQVEKDDYPECAQKSNAPALLLCSPGLVSFSQCKRLTMWFLHQMMDSHPEEPWHIRMSLSRAILHAVARTVINRHSAMYWWLNYWWIQKVVILLIGPLGVFTASALVCLSRGNGTSLYFIYFPQHWCNRNRNTIPGLILAASNCIRPAFHRVRGAALGWHCHGTLLCWSK